MHDTAYTDAIEQSLTKSLATIIDHWEGVYIRPALRPGKTGAAGSEVRAPMSPGHIAERAATDATMRGWGHALLQHAEKTGVGVTDLPPNASGPALADWLWSNIYVLPELDNAATMAVELEGHARTIARQAEPQRSTVMPIGECPLRHDDGTRCSGQVRSMPPEYRGGGSTASDATLDSVWCKCLSRDCPGLGEPAVARWWIAQGLMVRVQFLDGQPVIAGPDIPYLAHAQFGKRIEQPTIWKWTERGYIVPLPGHERPRMFAVDGVIAHLSKIAG